MKRKSGFEINRAIETFQAKIAICEKWFQSMLYIVILYNINRGKVSTLK